MRGRILYQRKTYFRISLIAAIFIICIFFINIINIRFLTNNHEEKGKERKISSPSLSILECDPDKEWNRMNSNPTNCPDNTKWITRFFQIDPNPQKTIINIGCNKGIDAIDLYSMYDNSEKPFRSNLWRTTIYKNVKNTPQGACGQVIKSSHLDRAVYNRKFPKISPNVYCVEPMESNIKLLKQTAIDTGLDENYFHIMQYVVGNPKNTDSETIKFPDDGNIGGEALGIKDISSFPTINVPFISLDALFKDIEIIDVLIVDTEGHDPEVFFGGTESLKKTRYVEFEVHRDFKHSAWGINTLKSIIDLLDNEYNFMCYWTGNGGQLFQITGCWNNKYETYAHRWSNIACIKRNDKWYPILLQVYQSQFIVSREIPLKI